MRASRRACAPQGCALCFTLRMLHRILPPAIHPCIFCRHRPPQTPCGCACPAHSLRLSDAQRHHLHAAHPTHTQHATIRPHVAPPAARFSQPTHWGAEGPRGGDGAHNFAPPPPRPPPARTLATPSASLPLGHACSQAVTCFHRTTATPPPLHKAAHRVRASSVAAPMGTAPAHRVTAACVHRTAA
jgi:hypothetical protein